MTAAIVCSFLALAGVGDRLPEVRALRPIERASESPPIAVTIFDGKIRVDGVAADGIDLLAKDGYWATPLLTKQLAAIRDRKGGPRVVIAADPHVPFIVIKKVLFVVGRERFTPIGFAVRSGDTLGVMPLEQRAADAPLNGAGIFGAMTAPGQFKPVLAEMKVSEGLDTVVVDAVVKRHLAQLRHCYEREVLWRPGIAGRVTIAFTIGPDGLTKSSRVSSSSAESPQLEGCLTERFKKMRFPAPKNGVDVPVELPFVIEGLTPERVPE